MNLNGQPDNLLSESVDNYPVRDRRGESYELAFTTETQRSQSKILKFEFFRLGVLSASAVSYFRGRGTWRG